MNGITLASNCDKVVKEARKTGAITYEILTNIPRGRNTDILREEFSIIGKRVTTRCPKFTAAGFFNVDYTMVFTILGAFTSYIVVIVQINKTK